ncbi:MAG: tRNA (adenosine(37)-N6)-threonylcarbamoyltransferase complex ATPase subunit type 1 TsaE [Gammaproteobacteria bacterium 39-13]|nr:tRNA (adenosine(37)-N6)-threonylcarbamoyltransferase complex ATPase subunit type 1 TsaE [Gammaproteobacteria bacterium]OJV90392.1 MAG: tRNA (adenosine(37)-N6)-threonylcarbamoyltransferase complex ATPase subunit type 1 TsaE [Gammaproteobacteria bacterium 39-13]
MNSSQQIRIEINDAAKMEALGKTLYLLTGKEGLIVYLSGELGAGKTTLVRGFLRAINYTGIVKSPTYTLVEPYELNEKKIYHFDFYRLTSAEELEFMGIRDFFQQGAICLIEWPEKASGGLPTCDLKISIDIVNDSRQVTIEAYSNRGKDVFEKFKMP